ARPRNAWRASCIREPSSSPERARALRTRWAVAAVLLSLAPIVVVAEVLAQSPHAPVQAQKITITSQSIEAFDPREPARKQFGKLVYRGGLILTSPARDFGGLSALRVAAD